MKHSLFRNSNYISDAHYIVGIDNMLLGFSKIKNISLQKERESIEQGGVTIPLSVETVHKKMDTLILEKAVSVDLESLLAQTLVPGCEIDGMDVLLMARDGRVGKAFYIESGVVTKRSFSDLDAASGDIFKLTLEIMHTGLEEI